MERLTINKINYEIWNVIKFFKNKLLQKKLINKSPTIISSNCLGGVLSSDLGIRFNSPTINLYMKCEDFIKFCENLEYYLALDLEPYEGTEVRDYPLGKLGDLTIYFVHYNTFKEARDKWNRRKSRVDFNNIFILATDRDGFTLDLLNRFENLPYKNKKLFTHVLIDSPCTHYITGFENQGCVGTLVEPVGIFGKRQIDVFDYVNFFNER